MPAHTQRFIDLHSPSEWIFHSIPIACTSLEIVRFHPHTRLDLSSSLTDFAYRTINRTIHRYVNGWPKSNLGHTAYHRAYHRVKIK